MTLTFGSVLTPDGRKTVDEFSPSPPARAGSVVSVLVVDDEAAVRRFARRVLERAGYGVFEAIDGLEALELIQGQTLALELVVSDIVMSGYATSALSERGIVAPCSILTKPFLAEHLLAEVDRCIRRTMGDPAPPEGEASRHPQP